MQNLSEQRKNMIEQQIIARGITNKELLSIIKTIPRHLFVNENIKSHAYEDKPLPIDSGQTISQPFIVALMSNEILSCARKKVLEIGTGSGYQSAILGKLFQKVFTIERISDLQKKAQAILQKNSFHNIHFFYQDGYQGLPIEAPFDAILVACASPEVPKKLCEQLAIKGKMVIPIGSDYQELIVIQRISKTAFEKKSLGSVAFVPMKKFTQNQ